MYACMVEMDVELIVIVMQLYLLSLWLDLYHEKPDVYEQTAELGHIC